MERMQRGLAGVGQMALTVAGVGKAAESPHGELPKSVLERQEAQDNIVSNAKQRVSDAIDAGGKRAKGEELRQIGKEVHDLSDDTINDAARDVGADKVSREPKISENGGKGSRADNEIVKGDKKLIHEKGYQLPKSGEQLERKIKQLENIQREADKGVLEVAKPPTPRELTKFLDKVPPAVKQAIQNGQISIVTSVTELYKSVTDFFK